MLADEKRTAQSLLDATESSADDMSDRRSQAREEVAALRARLRANAQNIPPQDGRVRPVVLGDALDAALERRGGRLDYH